MLIHKYTSERKWVFLRLRKPKRSKRWLHFGVLEAKKIAKNIEKYIGA